MLLQKFIKTYCRSDELVDIRFKCDEETVSKYYGEANEIPETLLSKRMVQQVRVRTDQRVLWNGHVFIEYSLEILVQPVSDNPKTNGEPTQSEKLDSNENDTTNPKNCTPNKDVMKLDKDEFLKTEFGAELKSTLELLDWNLTMTWDCNNYRDKDAIKRLRAQWDIFKLALRQFYGIEYAFTRTDEYFGVCTEDESDWLFKVEREID